jgi:16S rRNA U1498 N3-methylase RsmE
MQRYFSNLKNNNTLILSDNDIYHIFTVMRMKDKTLIEVVYDHELYICETSVNEKNSAFIVKKKKLPLIYLT